MGLLRYLRRPIHYPSSFLKLIIVGFLLVAGPLVFAIVSNAIAIHDITKRSQQTVHQAMRATEASRLLIEQITAMERSVRQASALEDPTLLEGYTHARSRFIEGARRMFTLPLDTEQHQRLELLRDKEAVDLSRLGAGIVEREVGQIQKRAEEAEHTVTVQILLLVPIAMGMLVAAIILISRPIAHIDRAIRALGDGDFGTPVRISGPRDLQRLGRQLDWMRLKLIDLEDQKKLFLHHVSHELKTPLAALKEGSDLLHEQLVGPLTPSQQEVTSILKHNVQRLRELIERLLSYHQTQFNKADLHLSEVPLSDVIATVGRQHRLSMASKGVRFVVDCPPVSVEADREKLTAIVGNLVSNAVKYAPRNGRVSIEVREQGETVSLQVADDGPGIRPEERERVFDPFFHGSTPHDGAVKGTGLGLAIVKEFVQAHRGHVALQDRDQGACLRVDIPRRQNPRDQEAA
jgi:two-component system sensor histidine kinase GlrK